MKSLNVSRRVRCILTVGGGLLLLAALAAASMPSQANSGGGAAKGGASTPVLQDARSLSQAFRDTAKAVQPAVVMIQNQPARIERSNWRGPGLGGAPGDGPLDELFRDPRLRPFFQMPRGMPHSGIGSGVIIDASGVILTNNHVVAGDGVVTVRLHDGRVFEAAEVKADPQTDLAIIRIEGAENLTAARLGDSDATEIGDWVLALGQPFGLEGTVTAGIISAKGRGIGITDRENFLQTDAAINPGNSGGPLVSLNGEVIGINTAISSSSGGNQGVGFAVPINLAKWVGGQLVSDGKVKRAQLGVVIQPVTHELAEQFGVEARKGVLVTSVLPDSPAAKAGLQPGDVVLGFADEEVSSPQQLQGVVERSTPGSAQTLGVVRDGKRITLTVTCREQTDEYATAAAESAPGPTSRFNALGLEVGPLAGDVAEQTGMADAEGVAITSVRDGSPAKGAGLAPGMVITQVNRRAVGSVSEFRAAVESQPLENGTLLLVRTAAGSRFVVLKP